MEEAARPGEPARPSSLTQPTKGLITIEGVVGVGIRRLPARVTGTAPAAVTTSRIHLAPDAVEPLAGSVLAYATGAHGIPLAAFVG